MKTFRESINSAIENNAMEPLAKELGLNRNQAVWAFMVPMAPVLAQIADFATTRYAINRGAAEANPVMKGIVNNVPLFLALKLGIGAVSAVTIKRLQDQNRDRAAKVVSAFATLAGAGPAIHNMRVINKL